MQLLTLLHGEGCVATIDAIGCRTRIVVQVAAEGGDHLLAFRNDPGTLASEVDEASINANAKDYAGPDLQARESVELGHGGIKTPRYRSSGRSPGRAAQRLVGRDEHDQHGRVGA